MTAVFRMKNHVDGGAKLERKPQQWVKVMGRLSDPKARQRVADNHLKVTGDLMRDPHEFRYYMGFSVDRIGFLSAFEKAEAYIADEVLTYGDTFEWKISGGEW